MYIKKPTLKFVFEISVNPSVTHLPVSHPITNPTRIPIAIVHLAYLNTECY